MPTSQSCYELENECISIKGPAQSKHSINGNDFWTVHHCGKCYWGHCYCPYLGSTCQANSQLSVAAFLCPRAFWLPNLFCCPHTADWRSWGKNNSGSSLRAKTDCYINTPVIPPLDWNNSESCALYPLWFQWDWTPVIRRGDFPVNETFISFPFPCGLSGFPTK